MKINSSFSDFTISRCFTDFVIIKLVKSISDYVQY